MLTDLEDYLEYIGGYRDRQGTVINGFSVPSVRLANYDQGILSSLGMQTLTGTALTDKQYQLAIKVVHKYRKQLYTQGITVPETFSLRMPIRVVDRSSSISYDADNKKLVLRFPYNAALIDSLREFIRGSCGRAEFDSTRRQWMIDATLPNLFYLVEWSQEKGIEVRFDVDAILAELYADITVPVLKIDPDQVDKYYIENNPGSMDLDLLNQHSSSIIDVLVQAGAWQTAIDPEVIRCAQDQGHSDQWIEWSTRRMIHVRPDQVSLNNFLDWVNTAKLWPVIWHSADEKDIEVLSQHVDEPSRIVKLQDKRTWARRDPQQERLIFFTTALSTKQKYENEVGLLVTTQSIIYQIKNHWGSRSRKIVYWGDKILTDLTQ